jgi:DNA-binding NarL/FixJ family response regulator
MTVPTVIANDHLVFRHGLRAALTSLPDLHMVGEAADDAEAVRVAPEQGSVVSS